MNKRFILPLALVLLLLLAACGAGTGEPAAAPAAEQTTGEEPSEAMMGDDEQADVETMDNEMESDQDEVPADSMDAAAGDDHEPMMDDDAAAMDDEDDAMSGEDEAVDEDSEMEAMNEPAMSSGDLPLWQTLVLTNAATGETFTLADFQGKTVFVEPMATWCSNCMQQQRQVVQAKEQLGDEVVFVGLSLETTLADGDLARYAQDNGFDWTYAVMSNEVLAALADQFGRSITSAPSTPHFIIRPDASFSELSTGIHSADEIVAEIEEAQR